MTWMRFLPSFVATAAIAVGSAGCRMDNPAFVDSAGGTASGTSGSTSGETTSTSTSGTSQGSASATGTSTTGTFCGDGVRQPNEACDGTDLGGVTCQGQGFSGGEVTCREDCTLDFGGCTGSGCGDEVVDPGEQCDGTNLGDASCDDVGHAQGTPACTMSCTLDYGGCYTCGDEMIEGPEVCDGTKVQGATCNDFAGDGYHGDGPATCSADCMQIVPDGCPQCGNMIVEGDEACDGPIADAACDNFGSYDAGSVSCTAECTIDTSDCSKCGNGIVEGDEDCEEGFPFPDTCKTLGFDQAKPNTEGLTCSPECTYDTSGCCNTLGNPCENDDNCCSGLTCMDTGMMGKLCVEPTCKGFGQPCQQDFECCSLNCEFNNACGM